MTPENYRFCCNALLVALLGSHEMAQRWWTSQNYHWNLQTPETVFDTDPRAVYTYLLNFYDR